MAKERKRVGLTRERVVDAAMAVLDRDGVDALSMRRVAAELGAAPGALYWHVRDKEELLQLLVDRAVAEIRLPEPDPARWQEQLRELAAEMLRVLRAHRDLGRITLGRIPLGPDLMRVAEWQLALLRGAGVPDRAAALAGDLFGLYIGAFAYEETLDTGGGEEMAAQAGAYFASLSAEEFPNVVALAGSLVEGGPEERFAFGVDVIIAGLAAEARR